MLHHAADVLKYQHSPWFGWVAACSTAVCCRCGVRWCQQAVYRAASGVEQDCDPLAAADVNNEVDDDHHVIVRLRWDTAYIGSGAASCSQAASSPFTNGATASYEACCNWQLLT